MRAIHYSLVLMMGLACASTAHADLVVQHIDSLPATVPAAERLAPCDSGCDGPIIADRDFATGALSTAGLLGHHPWANLPAASAAGGGQPVVRELPALPGSASLFLSAMLTVGAWHTMRKAGQLHLANLPEWYHAGAPYQIGHTVVFDPTHGFELLAVCPFDIPSDAEADPPPVISRDLPSRLQSQCFLTIESPRGPPALS